MLGNLSEVFAEMSEKICGVIKAKYPNATDVEATHTDATVVNPDFRTVVYHDKNIRVVRVFIPFGATEKPHTADYAAVEYIGHSADICFTFKPNRGGREFLVTRNSMREEWAFISAEEMMYQIENVSKDKATYIVYRIEFRKNINEQDLALHKTLLTSCYMYHGQFIELEKILKKIKINELQITLKEHSDSANVEPQSKTYLSQCDRKSLGSLNEKTTVSSHSNTTNFKLSFSAVVANSLRPR